MYVSLASYSQPPEFRPMSKPILFHMNLEAAVKIQLVSKNKLSYQHLSPTGI